MKSVFCVMPHTRPCLSPLPPTPAGGHQSGAAALAVENNPVL